MSKGYRGFASKQEYMDHYSDPEKYKYEIQSMDDYTREAEEERRGMDKLVAELAKHEPDLTFNDIHARHGVEIEIRPDGLVTWINVDGICRMRIISNGLTHPIEIKDNRK